MADVSGLIIKVSSDQLNAQASVVMEQIRLVQEQMAKMETLINNTKTYWIGSGGDTIRGEYTQLKEKMEKGVQMLNMYPGHLSAIGANYDKGKREIIDLAMPLSGDVIV